MPSLRPRFSTLIITASLVAGCGSSASPAPIATPTPLSSVSALPSTGTPDATVPALTQPAPSASAALPIRGSARTISAASVELAPAPDGGLFVAIPVRKGPAVLLLLDGDGRPRPGWPIAIKHSTACGPPLPIDDGSVRIVCDATDLAQPDPDNPTMRGFAFDADGRLIKGWPVQLDGPTAYGMGPDLTLVAERSHTDNTSGETISHDVSVTTVAADGTVGTGASVPLDVNRFGDRWAVGPDGVAYGVRQTDEDTEQSVITALDRSGARAGWPAMIDGFGSVPGFGSGGRIAVLFGSAKRQTSHVSVFDATGNAASSAVLPMATVDRTGDTGGCSVGEPQALLVARNGTVFGYSELDASIYGLTPSLAVMKGWPFEPSTSLATARPGLESEHEAGYCPTPVVPGVGRDGTLVLSLEARTSKAGGSLVAVGQDGRVRAGWPVELKRPGSEFWSVAVGPDGTTYALAIEPESGGTSSASILAIAPDSTVRYTTTIIEP
jgi:hypothetical protein